EVSDTVPAEEPAAEPPAETQVEEVSDTTETVDEAATVEEVSDTAPAEEPAPEAAPAKTKSLRHVPRSRRRQRPGPVRETPATRVSATSSRPPSRPLPLRGRSRKGRW